MNICFYTLSVDPTTGGVDRVTDMLARELSKKGVNVFLCYWKDSERRVDSSCYKAILCEKGFNLRGIERILSFVRSNQIDIFINPFTANHEVVPLLKALKTHTSVRLITVLHTSPLWYEGIQTFYRDFNLPIWIKDRLFRLYKTQYMRPHFKRLTRNMYNLSDAYVLLSNRFKDEFLSYNRIKNSSKLYVINNPIAQEKIPAVIGKKENIMLFVGRLDNTVKRIDKILKIWKHFHIENDNWQLQIVGDGRDRQKLENMVREMFLADVSFEGYQVNVDVYYRRAKILLMTSDFEGWPMAIVEGMRYGVVPIAYDTYSSLHDIIKNGENGFIVPPDDIQSFVCCLQKVINDFERMSQGAKMTVEHFSIVKIGMQWLLLFHQLVANK